MKKSILSIALLLIAFTINSQALKQDSTYTPVFYGKQQDSLVYCFTFTQTKSILKDVINSRACDSLEAVQSIVITEQQEIIKQKDLNIVDLNTIISKQEIALNNKDMITDLMNKELEKKDIQISKLNKKIKILKIERVVYPAIITGVFLYLLITLK